ncbi:MAG: hypothetical protein ACJ782_24325, partial [Actinomycetota bacterium]
AETRRTLTALALHGLRVDGLVANRVVPGPPPSLRGPAARWLRLRHDEQQAVLAELAGLDLPLRTAAHAAAEPTGVPALLDVAASLYGTDDPAAAGAAAPPLAASMRALWMALVGQGAALQTAYALDAVLEEAIFTLGPLLAGLVAAINPTAGLLVAAGLGLAGTAAFAASPTAGAWSGRAARQVGWAGAMTGPGMPVLVASVAAVAVAIGAWELGLVAAARRGGTPAMGGVLVALMALGSALGGLWYGAHRWRRPASQRFLILLGLAVLVCAPMAITPSLLALAVVVIAVGAVIAPVTSTANVLAAELAPAGTLTEAATWVSTATNVMVAAGVALAGALADRVGVSWTLAVAAAWVAVGLLVAVAGRGRLAHPVAVAGPAHALTPATAIPHSSALRHDPGALQLRDAPSCPRILDRPQTAVTCWCRAHQQAGAPPSSGCRAGGTSWIVRVPAGHQPVPRRGVDDPGGAEPVRLPSG